MISATRSAIQSRKRQYQLRNLMNELEERVHERDRFLAILGHELRNPLAAILLASQMLDAEDSRLDQEHAALIERQSRHLTRLVDDLLELSRVTAGKIVLQRQVVDLTRIVAQSIVTLRDVAISHEVAVAFTPGARAVLVEGDPIRLEQIFGRLRGGQARARTPRPRHVPRRAQRLWPAGGQTPRARGRLQRARH